jgi:hypothetical protein
MHYRRSISKVLLSDAVNNYQQETELSMSERHRQTFASSILEAVCFYNSNACLYSRAATLALGWVIHAPSGNDIGMKSLIKSLKSFLKWEGADCLGLTFEKEVEGEIAKIISNPNWMDNYGRPRFYRQIEGICGHNWVCSDRHHARQHSTKLCHGKC